MRLCREGQTRSARNAKPLLTTIHPLRLPQLGVTQRRYRRYRAPEKHGFVSGTISKLSPVGTVENSPGRQSWVGFKRTTSPAGTAENMPRRNPGQASPVPAGLIWKWSSHTRSKAPESLPCLPRELVERVHLSARSRSFPYQPRVPPAAASVRAQQTADRQPDSACNCVVRR